MRIAVIVQFRPSRDHVAGDLGSQALHQRHREGQTHRSDGSMRGYCGRKGEGRASQTV